MKDMIAHLHTFAHEAFDHSEECYEQKGYLQAFGEYLGITFAHSNPRKALYQSKKPMGNLPLEILNHLSVWTQTTMEIGNLEVLGVAGSISKYITELE